MTWNQTEAYKVLSAHQTSDTGLMNACARALYLVDGTRTDLESLALGKIAARGIGKRRRATLKDILGIEREKTKEEKVYSLARRLALALADEVRHHGEEIMAEVTLDVLAEATKALNLKDEIEKMHQSREPTPF